MDKNRAVVSITMDETGACSGEMTGMSHDIVGALFLALAKMLNDTRKPDATDEELVDEARCYILAVLKGMKEGSGCTM